MKRFILKVDDFRLNEGLVKFEKLIQLSERERVPLSIGVIGQALRGGRFGAQELFSQRCRTGEIEIWNHSFSHKDMTEMSDADVAWEIAATNSIAERALGHTPLGFGAPFNKCDPRIVRIAEASGLAFTYEAAFSKTQVLTPEYNVPFDGQPNLVEFAKRVERKQHLDMLIVQVHPGRWLTRGFEQMRACLAWLREAGYTPTTVGKELNLNGQGSRGSNATGAHDLLTSQLVSLWSSRAAHYDSQLSNFSSYFLARFRANSRAIRGLLRSIDADLSPRAVVDVGCGLAQWGLPFFDFNRDSTLWTFDTNTVLCDALTEAQDAKLIPYDLRICQEDFTTSSKLPQQGVDHIICANALNYIPTLAFARQAKAVAKDGAQLIILNQTGAFNHLGVLDALESENISLAKERAMAALRQTLVRLGFSGFIPSRTTPTAEELEAVLYAFGYQMTDDFVPSWERSWNGQRTFQGLVFTRRSWIEHDSLPIAFRVEYRKRVCRAGFPQLDDELFGSFERELTEPALALLKARSGNEYNYRLDPALSGDLELGRLIGERSWVRASQLVLRSRTENPEWLLAGAVAALVEEEAPLARELARILGAAALPDATLGLINAMCRLLEGDTREARAALDA